MNAILSIFDHPTFTRAQQGQHTRILRKMQQADRNAAADRGRANRWYHIGLKHNETLIRMEMFQMVRECVISAPPVTGIKESA